MVVWHDDIRVVQEISLKSALKAFPGVLIWQAFGTVAQVHVSISLGEECPTDNDYMYIEA